MSTISYHNVLNQARHLTEDEQFQLIKDLLAAIQHRDGEREIRNTKPRSLLELRGLGEELWKGIDVQKYIDQERNSWDG